jgi:hypothetical protein
VVIATLIFALMGVMLLGGHAKATRSLDRAQVARDMAELLGLRLNLVALQPEEYEDGDRGEFPDTGKSTRIVDEEKIFGDRFSGYTWEVNLYETIGAGAGTSVRVEGGEPRNLLFAEEGGGTTEGGEAEAEEEPEVAADEVDRMLFIRVTIYPPGYEEGDEAEEEALLPRSAWTAIHLPDTETETGTEETPSK